MLRECSDPPAEIQPDLPAESQPSDGELLRRFAATHDEDAFRHLVERHSSVVLAVCRRVLRNECDAEDAFQATWLQLARRAGRVRWKESVTGWLYKVAFRTAIRLRASIAKRRETALRGDEMSTDESWKRLGDWSAEQALIDEIAHLPPPYRDPILLCRLEGRSRREAAEESGCSEDAVKGRLQRGRRMLLMRLALRGVAFSAALVTLQQSVRTAQAATTLPLVDTTVKMALAYMSGNVSGISFNIVSLADRSKTMIQASLYKVLAVSAVTLVAICLGGAALNGIGYELYAEDNAALDTDVPCESDENDPHLEVIRVDSDVVASAGVSMPATSNDKKPADRFSSDQDSRLEAAHKKIEAALSSPTELEFIETPLSDVVDYLKEYHDIEIQIDERALSDMTVGPDTPVTKNLKGISLSSALNLLLSEKFLTYVIKNEVLLITSIEAGKFPKVYNLDGLIRPDEAKEDLEALVNTIQESIEPGTWEGKNAAYVTQFRGDSLLISHTQQAHEQIRQFLKQLR